ncbi:MAG: aspartate/glutamate racemase family protein [Alphaproteobacteria bacterium]|nr:MAG: aspartate/glutamate racemase family protein [Alphaproteobacteria bacterium]
MALSWTTIETGLYQKALKKRGILYQEPSEALREQSVEVILATIGQNITDSMIDTYVKSVLQEARQDTQINTIGLVCTELPLVFPQKLDEFQLIGSLKEAAAYIVGLHFGR